MAHVAKPARFEFTMKDVLQRSESTLEWVGNTQGGDLGNSPIGSLTQTLPVSSWMRYQAIISSATQTLKSSLSTTKRSQHGLT